VPKPGMGTQALWTQARCTVPRDEENCEEDPPEDNDDEIALDDAELPEEPQDCSGTHSLTPSPGRTRHTPSMHAVWLEQVMTAEQSLLPGPWTDTHWLFSLHSICGSGLQPRMGSHSLVPSPGRTMQAEKSSVHSVCSVHSIVEVQSLGPGVFTVTH